MVDAGTEEVDADDPDAWWNRDPVDSMPEVIVPGRVEMRMWKPGYGDDPVAYDFAFTWAGGQEADFYYDISMENDGLSPGSSAPFIGTAAWSASGGNVTLTYRASEFGLDGEEVLAQAAPDGDALDRPQTWADLAERIAGFCDQLIE